MIIESGGPAQSLSELVLFPFDNRSVPFVDCAEHHLVMYETPAGSTRVVMKHGDEGTCDAFGTAFYGSVCQVEDEYWMWYLGNGARDGTWFQQVCVAKSSDGYHWEKPNLGLVEFNGNRDNNLVAFDDGVFHVHAVTVIHEPEDTQRPFKMAFERPKHPTNRFTLATSQDGINWKTASSNPVIHSGGVLGFTRFNGCYYLNAQGGLHGKFRQFATLVSYDFDSWADTSCLSFRRHNLPPKSETFFPHDGPQVHLGAGLWNRGNVILGIYGMWNGHPSNNRRLVTMDLGLLCSTDALHYHEPIPDFPIVSAAEDGWNYPPDTISAEPFNALIQGQAFANIGEETLFWYAPWPEMWSDGIRVASWKRDRLGYLSAARSVNETDDLPPHCISAPIDLEGKDARVSLNVSDLDSYSQISVDLLDEHFQPIPGYTQDVCLAPTSGGLRESVAWRDRQVISHNKGRIRIRVSFSGVRQEDVKLYAIYLEEVC